MGLSKLNFTPSSFCFSADDKDMLKAFKRQLHIYKVQSLDGASQELLDYAYDLFHITRTQEESIKALEVKAGIREERKK
ncbi:MAG: hypothetical protein HXK63_06140 [Campylobacter sp.]|nr:hypothetical protein [Campylobacter sp.]